MRTGEFLQTIFPDPSPDQHVRFLIISPETPWPGHIVWKTTEQLHAPNLSTASAETILGTDLTGKDVYFTPHAFTRADHRGSVTKDDSVEYTTCAWVECDDEDLPPGTFSPEPSFVVETSPNRHHLYWLLDSPIPTSEVEALNWRLVHGNRLRKDTGGWHLVKLLRLPGTYSYKRPTPFPVSLSDNFTPRLYTYPDDFNDLPSAPPLSELHADFSGAPLPSLQSLPSRVELAEKFPFTKELEDLLDRQRNDRSQALWRMYNVCYRLGMTEEETFALVRGTPNDKFSADWRYHSDEGLWTDVQRGFRLAKSPEDTPVLLAIKGVRATKGLPAQEKRRKIAQMIARDLTERGRLYFDTQRQEGMYYDGTQVIPLDNTSRRWKVLLNLRYHVTEGEEDFKPVNAHLYAICATEGERVEPHTFSHYDRSRNLLYIYNGGGRVYRLDGRTIEQVDNGTDGILFRDVPNVTAFQPDLSVSNSASASVPTLDEAIFSIPNYADTKHTAAEAATIARLWTYSMFFPEYMEARPHLIVTGPTESGKTMIFQLMQELLNGPHVTVESVPTEKTNFETVVSNAHHVFFDNVDTPNRWFTDSIAEAATGIQITRRLLYTTNESITYRVQCFLGLTTRDPWFSRTDIATRLIVLETERRELKRSPLVLLDKVRQNRDRLWGLLMHDLNRIVAVIGSTQFATEASTLRMAAFGDFIRAAHEAGLCNGVDAKRITSLITTQQTQSALDHSIIWQTLSHWLRTSPGANGAPITANVLHSSLRYAAADIGSLSLYERLVPNARSLGHQLRELAVDIHREIDMEIVKGPQMAKYTFTLREDDAPSVRGEAESAAAAD